MENTFIWTEIYNCGKIAKIALESFFHWHPDTRIHVYGSQEDFKWIAEFKDKITFYDIPEFIKERFRTGHWGTASLWAALIQSRPERWFIHFDSDVVFRNESLSDLYKAVEEGHSVAGPIRNYKHNPNNRDDCRHLPDLSQTVFFVFDKEKIKKYEYETFARMCQGTNNPYNHPMIDFFDPVMFDIIYNGGTIKHLEHNDYGGCDYFGKRITNKYGEINRWIDFGDKLAHFSAVGSGMNFYHHADKIVNVPIGYVNYAVERYALYCKIFYNEDLGIPIDQVKYGPFLNLSRNMWFGLE